MCSFWQAMTCKSLYFVMAAGGLSIQPNFAEMSTKELTAYVLAHREDMEALHALVSRRTPDSEATWYGPMFTKEGVPIEENIRIAEEAIRKRIEKENQENQDRSH